MIIHLDGSFTILSEDHKPFNLIEKTRIEKAGSHISSGNRIDGNLNVSRTFGDFNSKNKPQLKQEEQAVIAVPDFMQTRMKSDDLLFIGCDGLFETCDRDYIAKFITKTYIINKNLGEICELLCCDAYKNGSNDNMTVILVKYGNNGNCYQYPRFICKYFNDGFGPYNANVFNQNADSMVEFQKQFIGHPQSQKKRKI
jgi:protein phosphatase